MARPTSSSKSESRRSPLDPQALVDKRQRQLEELWESTLDELELLREQNGLLRERGLTGIEVPQVPPPAPLLKPGQANYRAAHKPALDELDAELKRLHLDCAHLVTLNTIVEARLEPAAASPDLTAPPRAVPRRYLLAEWLATPYTLMIGLLVFALSARADSLASALLAAAPLLVLPGLLARAVARVGFLSRCQVAVGVTVLATHEESGKHKNMPFLTSSGWTVRQEFHTGKTTRTVLQFLDDSGQIRALSTSGLPYAGGVVLYDPQSNECRLVHEFWCRPRPGQDGSWGSGRG